MVPHVELRRSFFWLNLLFFKFDITALHSLFFYYIRIQTSTLGEVLRTTAASESTRRASHISRGSKKPLRGCIVVGVCGGGLEGSESRGCCTNVQ